MVKLSDQLKEMSGKERLDYLWEYYKWHLVGIIVLILFIWLAIDGLASKGEEPIGVTVISEATRDVVETLEIELESLDDDNFDIYFEHIQHQGGIIEENAYELIERLAMRIGVGQIDLLVTNDLFAEQLIGEDIFSPLDQVLLDETVDLFIDDALVVNGVLYGIPTADLAIFNQYDAYQDTYLLVPASGKNKQKTARLVADLTDN
ncbi:hypothetical protein [Amphibacillus xylanus]|uniref:Uncharacterized protein n=1 Tax=Amphibacillus xylanus (strain ATCC 51415 / DSM 6626 / JCM 7361 / LMG 17667 / NBRC 15112 / Ep01) TaxID=698758 RepID=K0IWP4_AMPXN|nr:hypothetical protein [Amphibacillus xylanus]BAM46910.1 hypothetical protein AXY_07780 [Amphibacillus xylanus NBRC 15112]